MGTPLYPAFLLVQPLLALGGTILVGRALEAISRPAAGLLSGGRLAQPRPPLLRRGASAKGAASPPGARS